MVSKEYAGWLELQRRIDEFERTRPDLAALRATVAALPDLNRWVALNDVLALIDAEIARCQREKL